MTNQNDTTDMREFLTRLIMADAVRRRSNQNVTSEAMLKLVWLIDSLSIEKSQWMDDNTDVYGDADIDDADWSDGIAEYNDNLASLGIALAEMVRSMLSEKS